MIYRDACFPRYFFLFFELFGRRHGESVHCTTVGGGKKIEDLLNLFARLFRGNNAVKVLNLSIPHTPQCI